MNKNYLSINDEIYKKINSTDYPYPNDKTICDLFEEQVAKESGQKAIIMGNDSLSYGELNKKADQIASLLQSQGIERNSIVGILVERSFEMIIGIFGILKAGAAYLPISPDYPEGRIEYMIYDSGVNVLLTQKKFIQKINNNNNINIYDLEDSNNYFIPRKKERIKAKPEDLMYIIYTSGSTGLPKGVGINNYSVVNRLSWMQRKYPISKKDTLLQKTPFIFDVSVWELFWWAFTGSKLSLLKPGYEKFPLAIIETVFNDKVTVIHFVPSMFNSFLNYANNEEYIYKLSSLKIVFCSGEALLRSHVKKFSESLGKSNGTILVNLYGPTEATIDVTYYNCTKDINTEVVPIGYPIDNIRIYIIEGEKLQPIGAKGELCLAGVGLARGYINKTDLTHKCFIDNPVLPGERIYKTGDYVSLTPDGAILYHGRIDNQVKIRGLRIELGEIESKICESDGVDQCVVLVRDLDKINPSILAFILSFNQNVDSGKIKKHLKQSLPEYMVPNEFIVIDKLPLTINGKVDRKALMDFEYK